MGIFSKSYNRTSVLSANSVYGPSRVSNIFGPTPCDRPTGASNLVNSKRFISPTSIEQCGLNLSKFVAGSMYVAGHAVERLIRSSLAPLCMRERSSAQQLCSRTVSVRCLNIYVPGRKITNTPQVQLHSFLLITAADALLLAVLKTPPPPSNVFIRSQSARARARR